MVVTVSVIGVLVAPGVGCRLTEREVPCAEFSFDRERWSEGEDDEMKEIAETLDRCDVLIGKTRAEVTEMLGTPTDKAGNYSLGYDEDDPDSFSKEWYLLISYNKIHPPERNDRVVEVDVD
jgi:hypothetical protein